MKIEKEKKIVEENLRMFLPNNKSDIIQIFSDYVQAKQSKMICVTCC